MHDCVTSHLDSEMVTPSWQLPLQPAPPQRLAPSARHAPQHVQPQPLPAWWLPGMRVLHSAPVSPPLAKPTACRVQGVVSRSFLYRRKRYPATGNGPAHEPLCYDRGCPIHNSVPVAEYTYCERVLATTTLIVSDSGQLWVSP